MPVHTVNRKIKSVRRASASLHEVAEKFLDEAYESHNSRDFKDYELTIILVREFVNTFGSVILGHQNIPLRTGGKKTGSENDIAFDIYSPQQVVGLFDLCTGFFFNYKVNMPQNNRMKSVKIVKEFSRWMVDAGYLESLPHGQFQPLSSEMVSSGRHVFGLLSRSIASASRKGTLADHHNVEPAYMVSRVRTGKLWFICIVDGVYGELGPVSVPAGVTDLVRPGWSFECEFEMRRNRWFMSKLCDLRPVQLYKMQLADWASIQTN